MRAACAADQLNDRRLRRYQSEPSPGCAPQDTPPPHRVSSQADKTSRRARRGRTRRDWRPASQSLPAISRSDAGEGQAFMESHIRSHRLEGYFESRSALQPSGYRQSFGAQEFRVEQLCLVTRAIIREYRNDGVSRPKLAGEPDRARNVNS